MIPTFNISGVLPPFVGDKPQVRATMSPYKASMLEFSEHFGTTIQRIDLLEGLLSYRLALHAAGINNGFQWLDGSFVEDVELTRSRPPSDIDVVTFAHLPVDRSKASEFARNHIALFHPPTAKQTYKCDAYWVDLDKKPSIIVDDTRYWFGLFSHQRDTSLWKGMIQVDLGVGDIDAAQFVQEQRKVLLEKNRGLQC